MKTLTTLIILITFISCGKSVDDVLNPFEGEIDQDNSIQQEFIEYAKRFEFDFGIKVNISIAFSPNLAEGLAGVCYKYGDGRRAIRIDRIIWDSYNDLQREQLIYHENGHCLLNLKHDDTYIANQYDDACPKSVMNSYIFSKKQIEYCYKDNRIEYFNRMK